jgi:hypothetical protein
MQAIHYMASIWNTWTWRYFDNIIIKQYYNFYFSMTDESTIFSYTNTWSNSELTYLVTTMILNIIKKLNMTKHYQTLHPNPEAIFRTHLILSYHKIHLENRFWTPKSYQTDAEGKIVEKQTRTRSPFLQRWVDDTGKKLISTVELTRCMGRSSLDGIT